MNTAVYCGTKNLYKNMLIAAKSLLIHSNVDEIYFLIEDDEFPYELPPEVKTINVSKQQFFKPDGPNYNTHWTYMTLIRAALSKILVNHDKVLSLDVDTIVNENISDLWDVNLDYYYLAGVPEVHKGTKEYPYINMGVVLFNLKKMRDTHKDDEIIEALNTIEYDYLEQDCINELCKGKIRKLDPDYNIENWTDWEHANHRKIIHFAAVKNWQSLPLVKKYEELHVTQYDRNQYFYFGLDIIIPAYNNVEGLRQTLTSIYNSKNYFNYSIIVVNDCSTENYLEIIEKFPYVMYITLEENRGPGYARNIGLKYSHKPYVMFIDCGDTLISPYSLMEIEDTIRNNTMGDIYQWSWLNKESNKLSTKNNCMMHGRVYKREFLELYNLSFCETPQGSYSNEDIGFNHTCNTIIHHIGSYDNSPHTFYYEYPIYKYIVDENSLTHKNNKEFLYKAQIPGLVENAIYCIRQCEQNYVNVDSIAREINVFLIQFYYDFLFATKKYPERADEYLTDIKRFYKEVYFKYESYPECLMYRRNLIGFRIKDLIKLTPRINIEHFLDSLKS